MPVEVPAGIAPIPVTVLSGFLGSGKTTFLNSILVDERFKDAVVIVNEFGDVAIDHALIETAIDDPILLKSGCICCSIRGDLRDTLLTLMSRRRLGEIPAFSRVIVETSGISDPGPVLQTLLDDRELLRTFALSGLLVTVDALNAAAHIQQFEEVERQIGLADCLLITKTDLASAEQSVAVPGLIAAINPTAQIYDLHRDQVDPDALLQSARLHLDAADAARRAEPPHGHAHHRFSSYTIRRTEPVEWEKMTAWLQSILSLRDGILRVKGFVRVKEIESAVALHCVEKTLYPPTILETWPDGDPETRLVFISSNARLTDLQKAMDAALH